MTPAVASTAGTGAALVAGGMAAVAGATALNTAQPSGGWFTKVGTLPAGLVVAAILYFWLGGKDPAPHQSPELGFLPPAPAAPLVDSVAAAAPVAAPAVTGAVNLYFDVNRFDAPVGSSQELATIAAYAKQNTGSQVGISGFHDKTGNAQANAELAKNRAKSVR